MINYRAPFYINRYISQLEAHKREGKHSNGTRKGGFLAVCQSSMTDIPIRQDIVAWIQFEQRDLSDPFFPLLPYSTSVFGSPTFNSSTRVPSLFPISILDLEVFSHAN